MKKIFTLIAMALMTVGAMAQTQTISFSEAAEAGTLNGKSFEANGLILKVTDSADEPKIIIDGNNTYCGTAEDNQKFTHRLKTGAKSSEDNNLQLTIPKEGTLKFYARPATSNATDRHVILIQDNEEIFNETILDNYYESVEREGKDPLKVYKAYEVSVKEGTIAIAYDAAINFYAFVLVSEEPTDNTTNWNFGTIFASTSFTKSTLTDGFEAISITDNLFAIANSKLDVDNNNKTWSSGSYTKRLKTGGSGNIVDGKVKGNGVMFKVSGDSEIKVCAMSSSSSATRKLILSDMGGNIIGNALITGTNPNAETNPVTFNYSGSEAILYLYSAPEVDGDNSYSAGGMNFYFISATNTAELTKTEAEALIYVETSINAVSTVKAENSVIYNALGQRVNANAKGIMIQNGKKYIAK